MKKLTNGGFGIIPIVVVLALVGLLVFAGLRINNSKKNEDKTIEQKSSQQIENTVKDTKDVESATKELDSVEVDKDLETSDLDNDISSVL